MPFSPPNSQTIQRDQASDDMTNGSSVHFNLYILIQQAGIQKLLDRIAAYILLFTLLGVKTQNDHVSSYPFYRLRYRDSFQAKAQMTEKSPRRHVFPATSIELHSA
jgi:hypothetical protein